MADQSELSQASPGAALGEMLAGQRVFMESIYSLMRFLEGELTRRGWEVVKNGGYVITRNGMGRGLSNFAQGDWVTNQMGILFVPEGSSTFNQGVTNTAIPNDGLPLLLFQVRWLDKSETEPVVWCATLRVEPEEGSTPSKWEDYQSYLFNNLEAEGRSSEEGSRSVKAGRAVIGGAAVLYSGTYFDVPVTAINNEEDAISLLVDPAAGSSPDG